jgi:hypothetical protein
LTREEQRSRARYRLVKKWVQQKRYRLAKKWVQQKLRFGKPCLPSAARDWTRPHRALAAKHAHDWRKKRNVHTIDGRSDKSAKPTKKTPVVGLVEILPLLEPHCWM